MSNEQITVLSHGWWTGVCASALAVLVTCLAFSAMPPRRRRALGVALGVGVLLETVVLHLYLAFVEGTWSLAYSLPLHLCRVSILIAGIALLTKRQLLYEWAAYLGVACGFHSIITPELTQGMSAFLLVEYYCSHSLLVAVPIVMSAFLGMKPRRWAAVYVFVAVNVTAVIVYPIDVALGANYMYLARRPVADNPFMIGPWPWYILGLEVACLLHLGVMDVLFRIRPFRTIVSRSVQGKQ